MTDTGRDIEDVVSEEDIQAFRNLAEKFEGERIGDACEAILEEWSG